MDTIPTDVISYCLLSFLNEKDHIHFMRTSNKYIKYNIKIYKECYNLNIVPKKYHHQLTNIITDNINKLPLKLTSLIIDNIKFNQQLNNGNVPPTLTSLQIESNKFNQPLNNWNYSVVPITLKTLIIYDNHCFNQRINMLPSSLTILKIESTVFNQDLNTLPVTLKILRINSFMFNQPINKLPNTLKSLSIRSKYFNQSTDILPITLTFLNLFSYNFIISIDNIPKSILTVTINGRIIRKNN